MAYRASTPAAQNKTKHMQARSALSSRNAAGVCMCESMLRNEGGEGGGGRGGSMILLCW